MLRRLKELLGDEGAATSIEYALIAGFISILIVAGLTGVGHSLNTKFIGPVQQGLS